ncbi:SLAM family member 8 isoform X2 [Thunnus albacares]|uniref:SLAM family member 8 isoform X2 n=1 Tax=Thunnus albacares TaxID=8236 RepID=UPI001CF63C26|nr:SLAM family member 8 isoform X2 [Thunnus albacares]
MFGGRLCCLSYIFTHSAFLLLWACLYDVEASSCDRTIHKKVGDTVELPSCLPTVGVNSAYWKHKDTIVAEKSIGVTSQFMGRVDLNPTDFSLTVRRLTLQDSGVFSLISEVNDTQRDTVSITLQVHEPIMKQPILSVNSTWHALNEFCIVVLECSAPSDRKVSYNWTVMNQTISGSRLQYNIQPEVGNIKFTCTIFNSVSEKSASETVKCSNNTSTDGKKPDLILILIVAAGSLMTVTVVGIAVGVCHCKKRRSGSDSNELTVYADICDIAPQDGTSTTMKPCSVYETVDRVNAVTPAGTLTTMKPCSVYEIIDNRANTVTPAPQTVYDQIQFNRIRNPSMSPYQEVP